MKQRCNSPKHTAYKNYGGRGIKICKEWEHDFKAFYDWSIANGYNPELTLDRIDNNGNYEPSNCRWATIKEQSYNRRTNRNLTVYGITHTLEEWSKIMGFNSHHVIFLRLKRGWTVEDAICTPSRKKKNHRWHEEFLETFVRRQQ